MTQIHIISFILLNINSIILTSGGLRTGRNVPSGLMFRTFYRLFVSTGNVEMRSAEGSEPENSTKNIESGFRPMTLEQQVGMQNLLVEKSSDKVHILFNLES